MPRLAIRISDSTTITICKLCHESLERQKGPALFVDGTSLSVCHTCATVKEPELAALLSGRGEAKSVGIPDWAKGEVLKVSAGNLGFEWYPEPDKLRIVQYRKHHDGSDKEYFIIIDGAKVRRHPAALRTLRRIITTWSQIAERGDEDGDTGETGAE